MNLIDSIMKIYDDRLIYKSDERRSHIKSEIALLLKSHQDAALANLTAAGSFIDYGDGAASDANRAHDNLPVVSPTITVRDIKPKCRCELYYIKD